MTKIAGDLELDSVTKQLSDLERKRALSRARSARYLEKNKNCPEFKARQKANQDRYINRLKTDPDKKSANEDRKSKARERSKLWFMNNSEYARKRNSEYSKKWEKENPHLSVEKVQRRNSAKLKAIPPWANLSEIREVYKNSAKISKETGVMHHVDHIVPLRGKLVCGLHVQNNLQIIPWYTNVSKGNKFNLEF
jgi:hypothetical protein